ATISGNFDVNVALSNNGDLVFIADVETAPGVFTTTVFNSTSVLAQEGQTIAGITLTDIGSNGVNGLLGVDNSGNAVFFNNADFFSPGEIGVVSTAGFGLETQSPFPSGPLAGQNILFLSTASFALAVNGQGSILLEAIVDQVGGLYTQDGLVVANGVIDGVDGFFFGAADLNDDGTYISNFSDFNTFNNGLVVDGELLITDLDTIEGFDIDSLLNGGPIDLNNNGDFVFVATLLDSSGNDFEAVIRATLIPEPSSLALLALGGLFATRRRRSA
ncbi:MAG: PEP-CTERM sorting domain-containing protein, partial [Planctomycetota bacterium]